MRLQVNGVLGCCLTVAGALMMPSPIFADDAPPNAVVLGDDSLTAGIPGTGPLTEAEIARWLADPQNHEVLEIALPHGLDAAAANVFIPEDNPITRAKIELGRQLYFDPRISVDSSVSCASCHAPDQGFTAHTTFGIGVDGQEGGRNSPFAYNRILSREQFWDGRAATLEEQAVGPIANPIEMGSTHDACVECLQGIPGYRLQFEKIFEDGVTIDNVGRAIATFERAIVTGPAPYDYYAPVTNFEKTFADDLEYLDEEPELAEQYKQLKMAASAHPMGDAAQLGMELFFGKAQCSACHAGANFTDEQYHNLGVGMDVDEPDWGRYEVTKQESDKGAFKTPSLRNISVTGPFMHDGSQATLEEVVEWYDRGGHPNPWLSDKMKKLDLTDVEKAAVVAFMREGLLGTFPKIETGRLPE